MDGPIPERFRVTAADVRSARRSRLRCNPVEVALRRLLKGQGLRVSCDTAHVSVWRGSELLERLDVYLKLHEWLLRYKAGYDVDELQLLKTDLYREALGLTMPRLVVEKEQ